MDIAFYRQQIDDIDDTILSKSIKNKSKSDKTLKKPKVQKAVKEPKVQKTLNFI